MMNKFTTVFIPLESDNNLWKYLTITSLTIYFFIVLIGYSFLNFFLLSGLIIVQLYFIISKQTESYEFKNNQFIYTFLFYTKTVTFTSFSIKSGEYKDSYKRVTNGRVIELYNENKVVCSIKDIHNKYVFDEILSFLKKNHIEITNDNEFKLNYLDKKISIIGILVSTSLLIFFFSFFIENYNPNKLQEYKTIQGHIAYNPHIDKVGKKNRKKHILVFNLKEYPSTRFILQNDNLNKMNGNEFIKSDHINNSIEFNIYKEDDEYKIKKLTQPYFLSHFNNKNGVTIQSIKYKNLDLITIDTLDKNNEGVLYLSSFILIFLSVYLGYCLYYIFKILN